MEEQRHLLTKTNIIKSVVRIILIIMTIIFLTLGHNNNGIRDVRNKAIRICYECIGIG